MKKIKKTNVMRILDSHNIDYVAHYNVDVDDDAARKRLLSQGNVFKTLVTQGKSNEYYVFVIPFNANLDLKKAANVTFEKSLSMILQKNLLNITGYVHGGCSPIGMKKEFQTFIDISARNFDKIAISGGKVKTQVEIVSDELLKVLDFKYEDISLK